MTDINVIKFHYVQIDKTKSFLGDFGIVGEEEAID